MKILKHTELTDLEFLEQFQQASMQPLTFDHEAHIRLVWIVYRNYPEVDTSLEVRRLIKNFATKIGEGQIYHETLTYAAVEIIIRLIDRSNSKDFSGFINENPRLIKDFKLLINEHYSPEILKTNKAKTTILEPDRQPF